WLEVSEPLRGEQGDYFAPPTALGPGQPPPTGGIAAAITDWAGMVAEALSTWPGDPVADLLRRNPPRLKPGSTLAPIGDDPVAVVSDAVAALADSYLAVQGPPGTGKTYVGAHVIARLVREHQWKVGVVGQSHAVVENLLTAVVRKAGLDASLVGKAARGGNTASAGEAPPFTVIAKDSQAGFAASHDDSGYVLGGTTWDFTNRKRFSPKQLDLLVIDEAGQFSLANTIAAASAARNLLLLGDPQQLPQVSQGTHPEPVDTSALGWIAQGSDVLPATRGYFLPESWRMHPAVAEPVSHLSYEGKLRSHLSASERNLEGVEPGLVAVPVWHEGNSTSSEEEALVVVELVTSVLGKQWTDPHRDRVGDPLGEGDVIVVTPYNAQLATVRRALDDAGFGGVRVGTVDKFQGQEAVVSIVTLAASSAAEVPRGMEFLIMRNRLNVAISRAQWAARLVYSPDLIRHLPGTPQRLAELSAFVTLTEPSDGSTPPPLS
ncbi:MAG TPA: DEAD/DEAH box helicase, partial [Demequina sp.]|nr:DEAD/DEAH box helicase [Demequina sp.]